MRLIDDEDEDEEEKFIPFYDIGALDMNDEIGEFECLAFVEVPKIKVNNMNGVKYTVHTE